MEIGKSKFVVVAGEKCLDGKCIFPLLRQASGFDD